MLSMVYVGLKTHSKITLVVRREEDGIRRYVHLGTGNYNDSTAKLYTDCGILTCHEPIGEDATAVFNMLSGYSEPKSWNQSDPGSAVAACKLPEHDPEGDGACPWGCSGADRGKDEFPV